MTDERILWLLSHAAALISKARDNEMDDEWREGAGEWVELLNGLEPDVMGTPDDTSEALLLITSERRRQYRDEGWTPEHDDGHTDQSVAMAAAMYAWPGDGVPVTRPLPSQASFRSDQGVPVFWPWEAEAWKPCPDNRVRELVKAGALIVAEMERLLRGEGGSLPDERGTE